MGNFAEYFLKQKNLPKPEVLIELSAARYEGSESEARIYFADQTLVTIANFDEIGKETRIICSDNLRMIRKLMEISKENAVYLFAEPTEENTEEFVVTRLVQLEDEKEHTEEKDIYIKFAGFMNWSVICGKREELNYYHGVYMFNSSLKDYKYIQQIDKLTNVDRDMVRSLVEVLKKQRHGTAVIISDYNGNITTAVEQLCKLNRGIRISPGIEYNAEEKCWNEEQLLSITGIDGALFMDLEGKCLAIGVLVDGKATVEGNVGRGARFNSINNYILQKEEGNYIGIVFSEDGMIDVIQNNVKKS